MSKIKILRKSNFATPEIYFGRPGGEGCEARVYLERIGGVWTPEQRNALNQIYNQPPSQEPGDETSWFYRPNQIEGANEMNGLNYRCVLDVFSHGQAHNERTGAQYFQLPNPVVRAPFWVRTENEPVEARLDVVPATLQIEPKCWKTLFLGESHRCAPLIVETTSYFRPLILKTNETTAKISQFFGNDANAQQLSHCLTSVVDDLIDRVNQMSLESYNKKKRAATPGSWKYTFPEDRYTCLNFKVNDENLELVKWLQNRCVRTERFVLPLRMALCQGEDYRVEDESWNFNLEILPQIRLAGDVVVLDCGTSSCSGAFTHPGRIGQTLTPEEQAVCRCEELGSWLRNRNCNHRAILNRILLDTLNALEDDAPDRGNVGNVMQRLNAPNKQYLSLGGIFRFTKEFERQLRLQSERWIYQDPMQLNQDEREQRDACLEFINKWYEIEKEVYETFSEISRKVQSANLNLDSAISDKTIVSEFSFKEDEYKVPAGKLGNVTSQDRERMAKKEYRKRFGGFAPQTNGTNQNNAAGNAGNIQQNLENDDNYEYYRNPKSQIYRIHHDKEAARIYQGFLNDALQRALKEYRSINWTGAEVPNLALTYPATLSPMGRRKLRELAMQLGFPVVDMTCDESVAPAIFYLEKFCGGAPELGLESFKTRCVHIGNQWYHNMLIIDVGAGTTDVSLVQFELNEKKPSNPTIEGGREYCITPYLLATQGNPHLAGNYLTLTLFHYLRALVALHFYPAPDGQRNNVQTLNLSPNLTARVLSPESTRIKSYASEKLPTNYMVKGITEAEFEKRYRRFNAFWDMAEKIKIQMSEKQKSNDGVVEDLLLDEVWIRQFFTEIGVSIPQPQQEPLQTNLVLSGVVFDALQNALVQDEIINRLARELTQEALSVRQKNRSDLTSACEGVDSVILSGCSSRLPNLEKLLKKTIQASATKVNGAPVPFATSRTRVFFENKYAKSATALGTTSVWNSIHRTIVTVDANPVVDLGFCASRIDVRNLVYYLSSSYVDASNHNNYFKLQTKYVKNGLGVGEHFSIMSDKWMGFARHICISKQVGNIINPPDYAEFDFQGFLNSANAALTAILNAANQGDGQEPNNADAANGQQPNDANAANGQQPNNVAIQDSLLRVRFEIDLEQDIYALVSQLEQPNDQNPKLFYTTKIKGIRDDASYTRYDFQKNLPPNWMTTAQDGAPKLTGNVEIVGDGQGVLFAKDAPLDQRCLKLDGKQALCRWSQRSFKPFATQAHTTTLRFSKNAPNAQDEFVTFNLDNYYQDMIRQGVADEELRELELKVMTTVELDEVGKPDLETASAHIFVGNEPAYAETEDVAEWVRNPGLVYRKKITNETPYLSDEYNPFSGNH